MKALNWLMMIGMLGLAFVGVIGACLGSFWVGVLVLVCSLFAGWKFAVQADECEKCEWEREQAFLPLRGETRVNPVRKSAT